MDERLAYVGEDVHIIKNNIKKLREDLDRHFERHLRALERRKQEAKKVMLQGRAISRTRTLTKESENTERVVCYHESSESVVIWFDIIRKSCDIPFRGRVYVSYRKLGHRLSRLPSSKVKMWSGANDATFCVLSDSRVFDEFSFHPKVAFVI